MKKILLWNAIGILGGGGFAWLFRDEFTTADAAPVSSPRTAEPGPGSWTITNGANLSIADGRLVRAATATLASVATYARTGLALYTRLTNTAVSGEVGFSANGTTINSGFRVGVGTFQAIANAVDIFFIGFVLQTNAWLDVLIIARPSGGFLCFLRGANYGRWRLVWVSNAGTDTPLYTFYKGAVGDIGKNDDFSLIAAPSGLVDSQFDYADYYSAAPVSGESGNGGYRQTVEITWTPVAAETLEMTLQEVDSNNKIILRCSQSGSTIAYIRKISGAETSLQSVAQTWTAGTPYRIVARGYQGESGGSALSATVNDTTKLNTASGVFTALEYATKSSVSGFATATDFAIWPYEVTLPAPFDEGGFSWFWMYGDSKTMVRRTQGSLMSRLEEGDGSRWLYDAVGRSGYTVSQQAALIATDLANVPSSVNPSFVIINLGTNDAAALPAENTWKANYRTIIEAIHAKWPSATIWLVKPVRLSGTPPSSPVAAVATMHSYIDGLAGEYAYVEIGFDETALENGDSYVTYFADFAHPNQAGYAQCAVLQMTAMGL